MHILINRKTMHLVCKFADVSALLPEHLAYPFIYINTDESPDLRQLTDLELKLLYRNTGQVAETNLAVRSSVLAALNKLISYKLISNPAQDALFKEEPVVIQAPTGGDRSSTNATALSGNKAVIWEVADAMWSAAGSPMDKQAVLILRRAMMAELEHVHGIKKTSSSNELGSWMKVRVP